MTCRSALPPQLAVRQLRLLRRLKLLRLIPELPSLQSLSMSKVSFTVSDIARQLELDTGTRLLDSLSCAPMQVAVRVPS